MQHQDLPHREPGTGSPPLSPVAAVTYRAPSPRPRRSWSLRKFTATAITAVALAGVGGGALSAVSAVNDAQLGTAPDAATTAVPDAAPRAAHDAEGAGTIAASARPGADTPGIQSEAHDE